MKRRDLVKAVCLGVTGWPFATCTVQAKDVPVIGVLLATGADDPLSRNFMTALDQALHKNGAQNLTIQYRFGAGDTEHSQLLARELVAERPAAIVAVSNTSMAALHRTSTTIPIVFLAVSDPVGMGYVNSLSRPGTNVTGLTPFEPSMGGKWLSFLKELAPSVEEIGVIFNPEPGNNSHSFLQSIESSVGSLAVKKVVTPHEESADIERTIVELGRSSKSGLVFLPDALTYARLKRFVALIDQKRIPAIYPWRDFVVAGGLSSYGPGTAYGDESINQAALYVDRILKGDNPAELPVQAPTKLRLVLNAKTAKRLGLEIPSRLLTLADEVID